MDPNDWRWKFSGPKTTAPRLSAGAWIITGVLIAIALYAFFGCTAEYAVNTCTDLDSITVSDTLIVVHKTDC